METGVKILKDGRISLALSEEMIDILSIAINQALFYDEQDLPEYLYYLLYEIREKLQDAHGRLKLRRSEFFALFSSWNIRYIDDPTQILLKEKVILPTINIIQPLTNVDHENYQIPLLGQPGTMDLPAEKQA